MIDGIGPKATGRIETGRVSGAKGDKVAAVPATAPTEEAAAAATNPASALAAAGAPIDHARVQEIRAAIANGAYALEVKAIAARMIALDLPPRG
ncbi:MULTISPECIES: flagellar biosynthesis anti-sigma factor FlgM [Sphingomonadales]|uniref:Negative regulator of flagellin synthesis n=1 Tax=Edaphosphingomonas haloaromaticamans TaxID=653954 RepID=A0A1S1HH30_9SPHN|nr:MULTISPECIES: flagellar biosynthesis anti-sigma factor FlgM [Sphingomonas]AGH48922.1 putative negative regulator of flagellin synthesis [Sphingomonas sp. MM-1]OHT21338.1 hypothetical protein BHE75_03345 [Sphingomonas haloaromaticamans]